LKDKKPFHFFASSQLTWHVGTDLLKLINIQKKADRPKTGLKAGGFNLYYVPLPLEADYKINFYEPIVDGLKWVLGYDYKTKETTGPFTEDKD